MNAAEQQAFRNVAIIGAGVIGASWVALCLAHGLRVCVNDPREGVEAEVRDLVARAAPAIRALGLPTTFAAEQLRFEADLERAVADAQVVQENGPERLDFKRALWKRIEAAAPAGALLLSSSSALPATEQSREMQQPGRLLVGHPFNPPHIIPLVEVVPGLQTPPEAVEAALAFYRALGKAPQVIHKEIGGFVANRLQAAIFRECVSLVAKGVVRIEELDAIVTQSVGLRWAVGGPFAVVPPGRRRRRPAQLRAAVRAGHGKALAVDERRSALRRSHHRAAVRAGRRGLRRRVARSAGGAPRRSADRDPACAERRRPRRHAAQRADRGQRHPCRAGEPAHACRGLRHPRRAARRAGRHRLHAGRQRRPHQLRRPRPDRAERVPHRIGGRHRPGRQVGGDGRAVARAHAARGRTSNSTCAARRTACARSTTASGSC